MSAFETIIKPRGNGMKQHLKIRANDFSQNGVNREVRQIICKVMPGYHSSRVLRPPNVQYQIPPVTTHTHTHARTYHVTLTSITQTGHRHHNTCKSQKAHVTGWHHVAACVITHVMDVFIRHHNDKHKQ